jgi:hypothetical protein
MMVALLRSEALLAYVVVMVLVVRPCVPWDDTIQQLALLAPELAHVASPEAQALFGLVLLAHK